MSSKDNAVPEKKGSRYHWSDCVDPNCTGGCLQGAPSMSVSKANEASGAANGVLRCDCSAQDAMICADRPELRPSYCKLNAMSATVAREPELVGYTNEGPIQVFDNVSRSVEPAAQGQPETYSECGHVILYVYCDGGYVPLMQPDCPHCRIFASSEPAAEGLKYGIHSIDCEYEPKSAESDGIPCNLGCGAAARSSGMGRDEFQKELEGFRNAANCALGLLAKSSERVSELEKQLRELKAGDALGVDADPVNVGDIADRLRSVLPYWESEDKDDYMYLVREHDIAAAAIAIHQLLATRTPAQGSLEKDKKS